MLVVGSDFFGVGMVGDYLAVSVEVDVDALSILAPTAMATVRVATG